MQLTIDFDTKQVFNIIEQLNIDDKIQILKRLEKETFEYRVDKLRESIPDNDLTEDDIVSEVMKVRYGR